jgi:hypothetical protein
MAEAAAAEEETEGDRRGGGVCERMREEKAQNERQ